MRKITIISMMLAIFLISVVSVYAGEKLDVQYIGVHFGNAEHLKVLTKSDYDQLNFHTASGNVSLYFEDKKLMGNPNYVTGYYGEVPEKMGFSANYKPVKSNAVSHEAGVVYVIDKEGTIAWKSTSGSIDEAGYQNVFYDAAKDIKKIVKKLRKGKTAKVLKEKKRKYLKKSASGELEPTKGVKIDKKDKGLIGWPVPDLEIIDESGNKSALKKLTKGKVTVLTFFTLNGVTHMKADTKGVVYKEAEGEIPLHPSVIAEKNKAAINQEGGQKEAAKMVSKGLLKGGAFGGLGKLAGKAMNSDEEDADEAGAKAYMDATLLLRLVNQSTK